MKRIASERILFVLIAAFFTCGCAGVGGGVGVSGSGGGVGVGVSGYGGAGGDYLKGSSEVTAEFEKYVVRPGYQYFYSGSDAYPNAILGLDKRYFLTNDLWKPVALTQAKLKDWVDYMQEKTVFSKQPLHGFVILDDKGNQIGVWYSVLRAITLIRVRLEPESRVWIDTPPQDVYREFPDRGLRPRL